ncbi:hypothetical protein [Paramaledivibacter caminithermalis]|jgi:hypothetical protein|uniref:Uncharacterized protein n=1 Tax=Paramaledivibacter caminithermalis (strain DSM 15212 / CIP 107654 / DViRD3) TaxID=1121301 RepID=A0A1M6K276_PARC5|nr:hypothetical protein [Paramaledivibacter caminithermalis]SHJ53000.1 hypothetical protein SAMN02745912_00222 [Paramaledivibacter caminithermalis DSM 15212]
MNIIQKIIWHVTKHRILSQTTIFLMGTSILLMAIVSLYYIFIKKKDYGRNMALAGVAIRILMLIAFTVELYHQMSIYPLKGADLLSKEDALEHLNYLLLLGYMVVVGIYYILTIEKSKYRGFFYTFDIGMMIIPIFNIFPILIHVILEGQIQQSIEIIVYISIVVLSIYLFFRMYWKKNILSYILLFAAAISPIILFNILGYSEAEYNPIFIIEIFLMLLASYEGTRSMLSVIIEKKNLNLQSHLYVLSIFPVLLIFLANPFYNIWDIGTDLGKYEVRETFYIGTPLTNLKRAEEVARITTGNTTDKIRPKYSINENFHNGYDLKIGDYWVQVASTEGTLLTVNRIGCHKIKDKKMLLKKEDAQQLSIDWLNNVGLDFNPKEIDIEISEEDSSFKVNFNKKFTDGSLLKDNTNDYIADSSISWYKDGALAGFENGYNFFAASSNSKKILDGLDIEKIIKNWYLDLGETSQPYIIIHEGFGFFPGDPYRLEVILKNKDHILLDRNGEVVSFQRERNDDEDIFNGSYEEGLIVAEKYLSEICKEWSKYDFEIFKRGIDKGSKGYYEFIYPIDELNSYYINIALNSHGKLIRFNKGKRVINREKYLVKDDFPISRRQALNLVSKYYKPFEIYNKRIMMALTSDNDENYKYNWMIVVFPFGKVEHHVYFVDPYTGDIKEVYGYKDGVIGE